MTKPSVQILYVHVSGREFHTPPVRGGYNSEWVKEWRVSAEINGEVLTTVQRISCMDPDCLDHEFSVYVIKRLFRNIGLHVAETLEAQYKERANEHTHV